MEDYQQYKYFDKQNNIFTFQKEQIDNLDIFNGTIHSLQSVNCMHFVCL